MFLSTVSFEITQQPPDLLFSRCPGASHRRVSLERRKTNKTQAENENENGPTIIDAPGTLLPEMDCPGPGPLAPERNSTSAALPVWTEEPGLDNPAFEESAGPDSTCVTTILCVSSVHCLPSCCSPNLHNFPL